MTRGPAFPPRFTPVERLGSGGGGEVWTVRDRVTGEHVALKMLGASSDLTEADALVREAVALSGLEGVGVPRVLRFGRLEGGSPFLVRELVVGESLASMIEDRTDAKRALRAVARVAEELTMLHRARLLHGDIKPANIIVGADGAATLVDLGLVVAFREAGERAQGLTPRFAAPELFEGSPATVRAEVYSLGRTLEDVVQAFRGELDADVVAELVAVAKQATASKPESRYPSVDELANALFARAPELFGARGPERKAAWPVLGLEESARALLAQLHALRPGGGIVVTGPHGSGRSTLLTRLSWSLEMAGGKVAWVPPRHPDPSEALAIELEGKGDGADLVVILDDTELTGDTVTATLAGLRERGAKIVVSGAGAERVPGATLEVFEMPPLKPEAARELILYAMPAVSDLVSEHIVARSEGWPGRVRAIVTRLAGSPVVGPDDVDRLAPHDAIESAGYVLVRPSVEVVQSSVGAAKHGALAGERAASVQIRAALERGHFEEAGDLLASREGEQALELSTLRARFLLARAEWRGALDELASAAPLLDAATDADAAEYLLELARAQLRAGDNASCERVSTEIAERFAGDDATEPRVLAVVAEACAVGGLAKSFLSRHEEAREDLTRAVELAEAIGEARTLSIAYGSLAFAHQRGGHLDLARVAYERALGYAQAAGDAGTVASTRLNLAAISKAQGDLAAALAHLEAAVDMGKRSGRRSTLRQALLNLANLDLYLGRLRRADVSIAELARDREDLAPQMAAQLIALEAESAAKASDSLRAEALCLACAGAYEALGRQVDAAEAKVESIFAALGRGPSDSASAAALFVRLGEAETALSGVATHRAALELARGRLLALSGDHSPAAAAFDRAVAAAIETGKRDWLVRVYQARATLFADEGQHMAARRDRESALTILEETASKLPRDLREVYWDEPTRRALRMTTLSTHVDRDGGVTVNATPAALGQDRLARVLEINREIAGTYDLARLLERVTDLAIDLLHAERGFVILKSTTEEGRLSVHASRNQASNQAPTTTAWGGTHGQFSQSIADRVIQSGQPIVTSSARDDARMADYVSVHQLLLQSVACVPIQSRTGAIGALYLETRHGQGARFSDELPLLVALSDQVAIAIETARLVSDNEEKRKALESANAELSLARNKLEDLLGHRTAQLAQTRRDLKSARAVLRSHFGYEGLVGTSEAMRRVYALIDRIKDTDVPILLTGESGTGKEVIARAIHGASPRSKKPFLGLNCGAIPEHLLESELFGHVRGAFTGAERDRKGLFREATEGTILLDEIGEMPHKMQAGLLRVLQEKVVRPVGGPREEPVDTRVIAATHRDLAAMVEAGTFREDLFYRLNVIQIRVPSLRERLDDVPLLIDHFLGIFAARYHRDRRSVSRPALKMLMAHRWPGNVRQLENALLNAWVLSDGPELEAEDFELGDGAPLAPRTTAFGASSLRNATSLDTHKAGERERILEALTEANWNRVRAAELVGMPRRTFYRRLKEYGIQ